MSAPDTEVSDLSLEEGVLAAQPWCIVLIVEPAQVAVMQGCLGILEGNKALLKPVAQVPADTKNCLTDVELHRLNDMQDSTAEEE